MDFGGDDTVALVSVYYENEYLAGLVFDNVITAEATVHALEEHFVKRGGMTALAFRGEIKTVYDDKAVWDELDGVLEGSLRPQGTLLQIIRRIDRERKKS